MLSQSLMNFILPRIFADVLESFRAIFKVKASAQVGMLAHERVSRAKQMMTPFVLRRRKDQVLKELPKKTERIEWCDMTDIQKTIYHQTMQRSRRVLLEESDEEDELAIAEAAGQKGRPKKKKQLKAQQQDLSSNVLMDLRKATAHPMLFRRLYDEETIKLMARACLQEPEFQESKYDLVVEDMSVSKPFTGEPDTCLLNETQVMTDAEIHHFCQRYKSVRKYALDEERHTEAGKVTVLLRLLEQYTNEGRRVLVFSQVSRHPC
jgi:SWI/SNF-related matrix-associated actin-dependent regulator of chromatin subfamily A containing DEAD/H box 1